MVKLSQYEINRNNNIARNLALLAGLDIHKDTVPPKEVRKPKKVAAPKKRKAEVDENDDASAASPSKVPRTDTGNEPSFGARRSARNTGKKVDYKAEQIRSLPAPISIRNKPGNEGPLGSGASSRKMCGSTLRRCCFSNVNCSVKFGSIPGIEVGTWWQTRYTDVLKPHSLYMLNGLYVQGGL
jgi:E3 ubiquitin-protein ligase UHRF1